MFLYGVGSVSGLEFVLRTGLFVPDTQTHCITKHSKRLVMQRPEYVSPVDTQKLCSGAQRSRREQVPFMVYSVPYGSKGCMVDALASRSDEGRDMAAISFGEVPNNL